MSNHSIHPKSSNDTLARAMSWLTDPCRRLSVTCVVMGFAWCVIMLGRLFIGSTVGLADSGDGHRLLCQLDVAPVGQPQWAWVTPTYEAYDWKGEACSTGGSGTPYLSTQWVLLVFAKALTPVLGLPGALDLRALGVVCSLVFGLAVALLTAAMPLKIWARTVVVCGFALATVDSAVAPYFISPFSEPAALLGMLFLVAGILRLLRGSRTTLPGLALVSAAALWTIFAKAQTMTLLIGVLPVMLARPVHSPRLAGAWRHLSRRFPDLGRLTAEPAGTSADGAGQLARDGARGLAVGVLRRLPAAVMCGVIVWSTVLFAGGQAGWLKEVYHVHQVFLTILPSSPTPEKDLRELGVAPEMAKFAGKSFLSTTGPTSSPHYEEFLDTVDDGDILAFWAKHPGRAAALADDGLLALTATRPEYLGNFLNEPGKVAYAKDDSFSLTVMAFALLRPLRWIVFPGLWLGSLAVGVRLLRHRGLRAGPRGVGWVLIAMSLNTVAQFWAVLLSDGQNDIVKHMVLTLYGTLLLGPLLLAAFAATALSDDPDTDLDEGTPAADVPWQRAGSSGALAATSPVTGAEAPGAAFP
ncbi:glycan biosynthesis hexose transferase WsfD [Streptomyces melanogenes]|uniref:glycan biosynthesis hexose transferase WsfD n=1 Tax=Streptomyces melanogenes TaxID=67326 RepID=UPI00167DD11C|nr:hypothetical protein [Streptomyces melanogenes]GGP86495.1 hypothetical protein GCM10010278_76240 [Streptomyces melanogenes]